MNQLVNKFFYSLFQTKRSISMGEKYLVTGFCIFIILINVYIFVKL